MAKLQKKNMKLKDKAHKYKTLFRYVRTVNEQYRNTNLSSVSKNVTLVLRNKRLVKWKLNQLKPHKGPNAWKLGLHFQKSVVKDTHGLEVLIREMRM